MLEVNTLEKRTVHIALPSTGEDEWLATRDSIESGWLTQGPKVAAFEKAFAARHGGLHALAVTSCTTGLHLVLAALGIGPGDEVLVPAFTWVATANVVLYCGATPILVDVDPVTFNLDPAKIAEKLTVHTKAIIPVHLFGLCADMDAIRAVLPSYVAILEDAACASGAAYKGKPAGSLGDAGVFSFHPRKTITTGEGGMITTHSDELAERMNQLRNHGAAISEEQRHKGSKPYLLPEFNLLGFNYRMTDLQGSVGLVQLGKLDQFLAERDQWATFYQEQLADIPWLQTPQASADYLHGWQSFVCRVNPEISPKPRNVIMEEMQQMGIATRPGTHAVHALGYYRERFGFSPSDYPNAWDCEQSTLAIPLHNRMSADDYQYVVNVIKRIC